MKTDKLFFKFHLHGDAVLTSCGKSNCIGEFWHQSRMTDEYVIFFGIHGVFPFLENDTPLLLREQETMFLRPNMEHRSSRVTHDVEYNWCHFYMQSPAQAISYEEAYETLTLMQGRILAGKDNLVIIPRHLKLTDPARILTLYQQMFYSKRDKRCYSDEAANHCLCMLLYELSQQTISACCHEEQSRHPNFRFAQILQWIDSTLHRHITIDELAETFCYSPNYLSSLFRRKTGYSTREYINRRKIEKASYILTNSGQSLKEIALQMGFQDYKYFLRLFHQITGETPSQMRNAWVSAALPIDGKQIAKFQTTVNNAEQKTPAHFA